MAEKIVIALISGGLALLGVVVSQIFEARKRKSEESRWYADYFFPKKFDSIHELYAQLQSTHGIVVYKNRKLKNDDEYQALVVKEINAFTHKHHLASIYLPDSTNRVLDKLKQSINEVGLHISSKIKPLIYVENGVEKRVIVDWPKNLEDNYTKARNKLAKELTPSFLKKFEKK